MNTHEAIHERRWRRGMPPPPKSFPANDGARFDGKRLVKFVSSKHRTRMACRQRMRWRLLARFCTIGAPA